MTTTMDIFGNHLHLGGSIKSHVVALENHGGGHCNPHGNHNSTTFHPLNATTDTQQHLPPGFRFHPTDEELITYYLLKKVLDSKFTSRAIADIDLNKCEPWELPSKAKMGEEEWYFFSLRDRKYPTGLRTNRATDSGYWKATGKDREITSCKSRQKVGMKKTLVFYRGRAPKGDKSNWVMHEYRLEGNLEYQCLSRSSKDEWVVCRVFRKPHPGSGGKKPAVHHRLPNLINGTGSPPHMTDTEDQQPLSPPSLPQLFDTTRYTAAMHPQSTTERGHRTQGCCSYESKERDHVSCFSNANNASSTAFNPYIPLTVQVAAPSMPVLGMWSGGGGGNGGGDGCTGNSGFPSLKNLQENLQFPFFSSLLAPLPGSELDRDEKPVDHMSDNKSLNNHRHGQVPVGGTELDCMWTFC